jgi:hypothetical protein
MRCRRDRKPIRDLTGGVGVALACVMWAGVLWAPPSASASPEPGWAHDHSVNGIPPRPSGWAEMVNTFGPKCTNRSNDARSLWPSQSEPFTAGYVYYHPYIQRDVGWNIRGHVSDANKDAAPYPGVGGYNCRLISGSTSWSVHSWGAAIDTNWQRNPMGQDHWNGRGADGVNYGTFLPDVWRGAAPGHHFFWGINWDSRPDPMHFQYVTDY